jgi:tRNA pseudouridine38-40 synthase
MAHWKLTLAYDGTPYHGWQIQPGLATIQGCLAATLERITGERVLPQGSGRTDAGVHALAQTASFSLAAPIPPENLRRALNHCLPPSIRVLATELVPPGFHARHSALHKTYEYRIFPLRPMVRPGARDGAAKKAEDEICPPALAPFVWPCPWPLDIEQLNNEAGHVVGTHDFTTFAAADPDLAARGRAEGHPGAVRTVLQSYWEMREGLAVYRVTGDGFLHHMVRNLVGTFVQAGARRLPAGGIPGMLAARNRAAGGPTAPASGLFLVEVAYPETEIGVAVCAAEPARERAGQR